MKLSQIKEVLGTLENVQFLLPDGEFVPEHFHVTEVGKVSKHFIDCGGTVRTETVANFQLWNANDYEHRLKPGKLIKIISLSEKALDIDDNLEVEVEYQSDTIGKYGIDFNGKQFVLVQKNTACLAADNCGVPENKLVEEKSACCTPGGGCC